MDWFLDNVGLRHERVKVAISFFKLPLAIIAEQNFIMNLEKMIYWPLAQCSFKKFYYYLETKSFIHGTVSKDKSTN